MSLAAGEVAAKYCGSGTSGPVFERYDAGILVPLSTFEVQYPCQHSVPSNILSRGQGRTPTLTLVKTCWIATHHSVPASFSDCDASSSSCVRTPNPVHPPI